jgi:uncharacterized membrane protein
MGRYWNPYERSNLRRLPISGYVTSTKSHDLSRFPVIDKIIDSPFVPLEDESKESYQFTLRILLIGLLLLGLFFRFPHLERKIYWQDEVYTSMQLSGYTYGKMKQGLTNGQLIGVKDLWKYQYPRPEGNFTDPVRVLAAGDSQHVPLYYVMLWGWVCLFGNSVAVTRSLSALISVFAIFGVYWRGRSRAVERQRLLATGAYVEPDAPE